jgi:hypothetical protein
MRLTIYLASYSFYKSKSPSQEIGFFSMEIMQGYHPFIISLCSHSGLPNINLYYGYACNDCSMDMDWLVQVICPDKEKAVSSPISKQALAPMSKGRFYEFLLYINQICLRCPHSYTYTFTNE